MYFFKYLLAEPQVKPNPKRVCSDGNSSINFRNIDFNGKHLIDIGSRKDDSDWLKNVIDFRNNYDDIKNAIFKNISIENISMNLSVVMVNQVRK